MASIWTGSIALGLVNIPVKVETAVRSHDLSFRLLHQPGKKGSLCPVKHERVCKDDGIRVLVFATPESAALVTRNGNDKAAQFPVLRVAAASLLREATRCGRRPRCRTPSGAPTGSLPTPS